MDVFISTVILIAYHFIDIIILKQFNFCLIYSVRCYKRSFLQKVKFSHIHSTEHCLSFIESNIFIFKYLRSVGSMHYTIQCNLHKGWDLDDWLVFILSVFLFLRFPSLRFIFTNMLPKDYISGLPCVC